MWFADLDLTDELAPSTRALDERNMRQLVMPAFESHTLREINVRKVDQFIKKLGASGPDFAAELLGHTSSKITKEQDISPTRQSIW